MNTVTPRTETSNEGQSLGRVRWLHYCCESEGRRAWKKERNQLLARQLILGTVILFKVNVAKRTTKRVDDQADASVQSPQREREEKQP